MKPDNTSERIVLSALKLFQDQGLKRTSLTDIAFLAGVTRVTVYRYFADKKELVRAVCMKHAGIFQEAANEGPADSMRGINARLNRMGVQLAALPKGNLFEQFEEINRLYPDAYEEFRTARLSALDTIFQHALDAATQDGTLREGLNLEVLKAIFWASVIGLMENQAILSSKVQISEIFETITEVFRHGILKNE
jgi:AcrR family transcriptional regulator